jgi:hypothetical protein
MRTLVLGDPQNQKSIEVQPDGRQVAQTTQETVKNHHPLPTTRANALAHKKDELRTRDLLNFCVNRPSSFYELINLYHQFM